MLLSGATIFHDFPAQYGLGPTFLIASICGHDCWQGMYFISSFTTLIFSICIATLALTLTANRWPERLIVLALSLATCFFWAGFPPFVGSPIQTPSVTGLRFFPIIMLVTYLFFASGIEHSKIKKVIAHSFWAFGTLWSVESAFYVTCVWWPYYIFIQRTKGNITTRFKGLLKASAQLILIAISLTVIFNIIFYVIYGKRPSLYAFLAYALNPPGVCPINPYGGILYFILVTSIGIATLFHLWHKSGDTFIFRSGFLILLSCYSVFSYCLGRSHDNNFLNILPFILLVLLHIISAINNKKFYLYRISLTCLMALLGWLPAFGWTAWHENISRGRLLSFNSKLFNDYMTLSNPLTDSAIPFNKNVNMRPSFSKEAWNAINSLKRYREPITILDSNLCFVSIHPAVWSAFHGPANYAFIPSDHRRKFLQATAKSLHRSGWVIVEKKYPAVMFLEDFDFVYQRTNYLDFGGYYAVRFSPKKNS